MVHVAESLVETLELHVTSLNNILHSLEQNFVYALQELDKRTFTSFAALDVNRNRFHTAAHGNSLDPDSIGEWFSTLSLSPIEESFKHVKSILPIIQHFPLRYVTFLNANLAFNNRFQIGDAVCRIRQHSIKLLTFYQSIKSWGIVLDCIKLRHPEIDIPMFSAFKNLSDDARFETIFYLCKLSHILITECVEGTGDYIIPEYKVFPENVTFIPRFVSERWEKDQILNLLHTFRSYLRGFQ